MKISIMEHTSWGSGSPSSAGLEELARFREKIYHATAAPMKIAAMEQPTAIPTIAPLLRPDEVASLVVVVAVSEVPIAVGTGELVGVIFVLDATILVPTELVDVIELDDIIELVDVIELDDVVELDNVIGVDDVVELDDTIKLDEGAMRILAICFPSPRLQQVTLSAPQQ